MRDAVIVSAVRTAIGNFGGAFKETPVVTLGAHAVREALIRAGFRPQTTGAMLSLTPTAIRDQERIPLETRFHIWDDSLSEVHVDEVIMGHVLQGGQGQNPARQAMVYAGVPKETPAFTINKVCASGLKAIALAHQTIVTGEADVVIAGGMENMSMAPMFCPRRGGEHVCSMPISWTLWFTTVFGKHSMGTTWA